MNISDLFVTMAQTAEVVQPSLFPFPFVPHLVFCCISVIFFVLRFIKSKAPYHIIMAVAIPVSLIIWLSESREVFYGVGIAEAVMLLLALVSTFVFRKKEPVAESAETKEEKPTEKEQTE